MSDSKQLVLSCAMQLRDKVMNISADQGAMTVQRALFSSTAAGSNSADVAATWITTVVVLRPLPLRIAHSCTGNASQPQPPSHLSNMRHGASLIVRTPATHAQCITSWQGTPCGWCPTSKGDELVRQTRSLESMHCNCLSVALCGPATDLVRHRLPWQSKNLVTLDFSSVFPPLQQCLQ